MGDLCLDKTKLRLKRNSFVTTLRIRCPTPVLENRSCQGRVVPKSQRACDNSPPMLALPAPAAAGRPSGRTDRSPHARRRRADFERDNWRYWARTSDPQLVEPDAPSRALAAAPPFCVVCSTFLASPASALTRVRARFRSLLLAPVSTVTRLRRRRCDDEARAARAGRAASQAIQSRHLAGPSPRGISMRCPQPSHLTYRFGVRPL